MRCATCNEEIIEGQDTRDCEICGRTMHASCAVDRPSPVEEYLRTIYSDRLPVHPTTYCFFCYEIETVMVRDALIGRAVKLAIDTAQAAWRKKYEPILDAWPRTPKCDESPIGTVLDTIHAAMETEAADMLARLRRAIR